MVKKFTINGITYVAREFDFDLVCDFDELGIDLDSIFSKQMASLRGYLAICGGMTKEEAGAEINKHIIGGNNLNELIALFKEVVTESDFFRTLTARAEEETPTEEETESKTTAPKGTKKTTVSKS